MRQVAAKMGQNGMHRIYDVDPKNRSIPLTNVPVHKLCTLTFPAVALVGWIKVNEQRYILKLGGASALPGFLGRPGGAGSIREERLQLRGRVVNNDYNCLK